MTESALEFNRLLRRVQEWKDRGLTIALCHGCFDPLHVGHVDHLEQASTFCDRLVVTVTADRFVNKGPRRPFVTAADRVRVVAAIRFVDGAAINPWPVAYDTLQALKPNIFVKGSDYNGDVVSEGFQAELEVASRFGIEIRYTNTTKRSATELVNLMERDDASAIGD